MPEVVRRARYFFSRDPRLPIEGFRVNRRRYIHSAQDRIIWEALALTIHDIKYNLALSRVRELLW